MNQYIEINNCSEKKTILMVCHSSEKSGGGEDDFERLAKYLYGKYRLIGILPKGDRLEKLTNYFSEFLIIDINIFPFSGFSEIRKYLSFLKRALKTNQSIREFLLNRKIDCAFINSSVNFPIVSELRKANIPVVISIKEVISPSLFRILIYLYLKNKVSDVIVISKYLYRKVSKIIKQEKIHLIYSSIEPLEFEILKKINSINNNESEEFTIVNIGAISKYKGQHVILKAIQNVRKHKIVLNFVGRITDKKYYLNLQRKISKLDQNIKVNFIGEVPKNVIFDYILSSDVVVMSSFEEGMSFVVLETLFMRKIIVASNVGISEEVIKNNENGFVFPAGNNKELYRHLNFLLNNRNTSSKFRYNSTKYFSNKFNLYENLESLNQIFIKNIYS